MIINAGGQRASWVLQLSLYCLLGEPNCPVEPRAKSMALIWTAAGTFLQNIIFLTMGDSSYFIEIDDW